MSSAFSLDQLKQMLLEDWSEVFIQFHSLDRRLGQLKGLEEMQAHAPLFKCVLEFKELLKEFPFEGEYPGRAKTTIRFESQEVQGSPRLKEKMETFMRSTFMTTWECRAKLELAKRFVRISQSRAKLQALLPVFRLLKVSITEVAHLLDESASAITAVDMKRTHAPSSPSPSSSSSSSSSAFDSSSTTASTTTTATTTTTTISAASSFSTATTANRSPREKASSSAALLRAQSTILKGASANAHLSSWLHLAHIRNRARGKTKKLWVALDALALTTAPTDPSSKDSSADLKSTSDLSLYALSEMSLLACADKRDEHLLEVRLGTSKDQGVILLFNTRTELARWAVAIDSLRAFSATGGQFLLDAHTRSTLLQAAWQEPFNGGVLTARMRDGHLEEWSYSANGNFECMSLPIGDSLYSWDGNSLRPKFATEVSAAASATSTVSQGFATFDGVFLVFYGVSLSLSDRYSWHPMEKEFRRTTDSPCWDEKQYVVSVGSANIVSPAPTEISVEGTIPPPLIMAIMCMRGWTTVRK